MCARDRLRAVLSDDAHSVAANGLKICAAGDERDVLSGCREPSAYIATDCPCTNDRDLHARARNGFKTNIANNAATRFMTAAVMNTPRHPAADAPIKLLSGTSNEATPFAT